MKTLLINLIGKNQKLIYNSAIEIHMIVVGNRFGSKIIENIEEMTNQKRDVFINTNNVYLYDFRQKNIFTHNLFIVEDQYNVDIIDTCKKQKQIIYNVNHPLNKKKEQIEKILYNK